MRGNTKSNAQHANPTSSYWRLTPIFSIPYISKWTSTPPHWINELLFFTSQHTITLIRNSVWKMDISPKIDYTDKWVMPQCPPPPPRPVYEIGASEEETSSASHLLRLPSFSRLLTTRRIRSSSQQRRSGGFVSSAPQGSEHGDVGFFVDFVDEPSLVTERPLPRFSLKPRASKVSDGIRTVFNSVRSSTSNGLTRVASSPLFARRASETQSKPPLTSRRPSMTFMSRRSSFSLNHSTSFSLNRRPSFLRTTWGGGDDQNC